MKKINWEKIKNKIKCAFCPLKKNNDCTLCDIIKK